jgi:hypothetical protein
MPAAKTKKANSDAPREIIFDAVTKCEHVSKWYGPRGTEMLSCRIDLRLGGAWRFVQRLEGNEFAFSGVFREIVRPERVVQTWNFEGIPPGHESIETLSSWSRWYDGRGGGAGYGPPSPSSCCGGNALQLAAAHERKARCGPRAKENEERGNG